MEVRNRTVDGRTILDVEGDVDLSSSPELRSSVLDLVGPDRPSLAVNLAKVSYMDSSGLATLVEAFQITKTHGGRLVLYGLSERLRHIFELAHLHTVFQIRPDEAAALDEMGGGDV